MAYFVFQYPFVNRILSKSICKHVDNRSRTNLIRKLIKSIIDIRSCLDNLIAAKTGLTKEIIVTSQTPTFRFILILKGQILPNNKSLVCLSIYLMINNVEYFLLNAEFPLFCDYLDFSRLFICYVTTVVVIIN